MIENKKTITFGHLNAVFLINKVYSVNDFNLQIRDLTTISDYGWFLLGKGKAGREIRSSSGIKNTLYVVLWMIVHCLP